MLDFDTAIEILKKYGFSSTSVHPYLYQNDNVIGLCYEYEDEDYGTLERIKVFDDKESFEEFVKQLNWLNVNGKTYHVRMILDNYESMNPKTLFLRNEKIMMAGEMFDIEQTDLRESQRNQMDEVSQILYEAGDLLLVYDEIKGRQLQYLQKLVDLKNVLRQKYFDLQKEVDIYNNNKVERTLNLLPNVFDKGSIDEQLEIAIKDRYNLYISRRPSLEEITDFIKEIWNLNKNLEMNVRYYEAQKEENDVRNEIKVVDKKMELISNLNDEYKPFLGGIDLVNKFRKINIECKNESTSMADSYVTERIENINKKYAVYDELNLLYTSDYLREAIQNSNYGDLAIKYSKNAKQDSFNKPRLPLNEVAADLTSKNHSQLSLDEQAILTIYNNHKFRKICNAILAIDNFEQVPLKDVVKKVSSIKGFSKLKTECYDSVKKRIDDPVNQNIKQALFNNYDFTSFETFISSLVRELAKLRNVNNKMTINSDINMYLLVKKLDDISNRKFILVTNDLSSLLVDAKENNLMIGIALLKEQMPVLYSPYYFDVGDIYSKNASPEMAIKEMVNFELLIETSDILINIDTNKTNVARYYTKPKLAGNISYVDDIKLSYKTTFCKYSFISNLSIPSAVVSEPTPVVEQKVEVEPVTPVPPAPEVAEVQPVVPAVHEPVAPTVPEPVVPEKFAPEQAPLVTPPVNNKVVKVVVKKPVEPKVEENKEVKPVKVVVKKKVVTPPPQPVKKVVKVVTVKKPNVVASNGEGKKE